MRKSLKNIHKSALLRQDWIPVIGEWLPEISTIGDWSNAG